MCGKRLFLDMDGTIARFYDHADCLEQMFRPGFFAELGAYTNVVNGIQQLVDRAVLLPSDLFVVSAADRTIFDQVIKDKESWLQEFSPEENRVFIPVGESKARAIEAKFGFSAVPKSFVLLDDYNQHLRDWEEAGGTSVKLVNEINDRGSKGGSLWSGKRIRYDFVADRICEELAKIVLAR